MVKMNRRSQWLLFALGFVAAANGMLLGVFLYTLLAALLHLLSDHAPGVGWGLTAGGLGAAALLGGSIARAGQTRRLLYGKSLLDYEVPAHARLVDRLERLTKETALASPPSLRLVGGALPNAYTVSRSREEAAIVLTEGLLERLGPAEQEAVIAHEQAQVENDDVGTVWLADAVAVSIEELSRLKGRYFWGPREIMVRARPFLLAVAAMLVLVIVGPNEHGSGMPLIVGLATIGVAYALWKTAIRSPQGAAQLVLFTLVYGPLTLFEWLLAPPTAFALSRLVSRQRITEADRRAVELTGDPDAAVAALRRLEGVEYSAGEPFWADLRYALFVVPRAQSGYLAWLERIFSTHPPIAVRISRLARGAQERSRLPHRARHPERSLEQSR
jgi:Zn-dependent protease with chaperone function